MRRWVAAAALAGVLAASGAAHAWLKSGPNVVGPAHHRLQGAIGVLDGGGSFGNPAAAYSFRKLKSTYSGSAVRLRRASDQAEQDINFLGFVPGLGSPFDVAAANAFCNATSCFVKTWYDQSGNGRHAAQATAAGQPALVFNCNGTLPCGRVTAAGPVLVGPSVTPSAGQNSASVVANRSVGTGQINLFVQGFNYLYAVPATAQWSTGSTVFLPQAASDNAWHAAAASINGASSVLRIDAAEAAGTADANAGAGAITLLTGVASTTLNMTEAIWWNGYALTATERAALTANQRGYWGF